MTRKISAIIVGVIVWFCFQIISIPMLHILGLNRIVHFYFLMFLFTILIGLLVSLIAKGNSYLVAIITVSVAYYLMVGSALLLGISSTYNIASTVLPILIMWIIFVLMSTLGAFISTRLSKVNKSKI